MRNIQGLLLCLFLAPSLSAQQNNIPGVTPVPQLNDGSIGGMTKSGGSNIGPALHVEGIVPKSVRDIFGDHHNNMPLAWTPIKYQQVFDGAELPAVLPIFFLGFRQSQFVHSRKGQSIDVEIKLGFTKKNRNTLTTNYANNFDSGTPVLVLNRQIIKLNNFPLTYPTDPHKFFLEFKLSRAFLWVKKTGRNLLIEITVFGNSNNNLSFNYQLDAASGTTSTWLWSGSAVAIRGQLGLGGALVMNFLITSRKGIKSGSYEEFGNGCKGTGIGASGPACILVNSTASAVTNTLWRGSRYVFRNKTTSAIALTGFEFFGRDTAARRIAAFVYMDTNGMPAATAVRKSSLKTTTTTGWHKVTITPPLPIAANTTFYIGYVGGAGWNTEVTTGPTASYFRNTGGWGWFGPWNGRRFAWKVNCGAGSPVPPSLTHKGEPDVAHRFDINLGDAKKNSSAIFILGTTKLNISLAGIGAPTCTLLSSLDLLLVVPTGANGAATLALPIPNDMRLVGATFFNQFAVIDAGANSLGIAFSNGGKGIIGR